MKGEKRWNQRRREGQRKVAAGRIDDKSERILKERKKRVGGRERIDTREKTRAG